MQINLLQSEEELYRDFIDSNPNASIYHTLEWRDIVQETYRYKPQYIIARDGETIKGVLPLFQVNSYINGRRLVSIPFTHRVNILYHDISTLQQMIRFAKDLVSRSSCNYLEIRHGMDLPESVELKCSPNFFDSTLDISGPLDGIWGKFEGSVRRAIRKGRQSDLKITQGTELEDYRIFYELELETRKRQGSPPYSFRFFENLHSKLHTLGKAKLYFASFNNQDIAGVIILYYKKIAIYAYGASTSDRDFLKLRPNNLLFWQAIQDAHQCGCQLFDFGTTHPSNKGLLRFKSGWGTSDIRIPYYYFLNTISDIPVLDRDSFKLRFVSGILKRMPLALLRTVGPVLLKQLG